ncbi:hypothetical protein HID58_075086 [Brassica napus]|uniref:Uncharacterized protein n=1 Tax=Brassica napus TaxID=3708 RepID=A0ABQ7YJV3_BRANA|nr:hypothetical protein HID58_075086 [Brassica napus]
MLWVGVMVNKEATLKTCVVSSDGELVGVGEWLDLLLDACCLENVNVACPQAQTMGSSREASEEQFTLNTDYSPPATCDLGTQQLIARLSAEEERNDLRADGVNDRNKQARKRMKIMLVDSEEESDVEITPPTRSSKPHRQTTFGTATRKPMLQSTLDGGSGSFARARSQKKAPLKAVIRGERRKASTQALSSEARKKKGSSTRANEPLPPSRVDCNMGFRVAVPKHNLHSFPCLLISIINIISSQIIPFFFCRKSGNELLSPQVTGSWWRVVGIQSELLFRVFSR